MNEIMPKRIFVQDLKITVLATVFPRIVSALSFLLCNEKGGNYSREETIRGNTVCPKSLMKYYFYGVQNYKNFRSHFYDIHCLVEPINPNNDQSKYLLNSTNCSSGFWDEIFHSNFFRCSKMNLTQLGTHLSKRYITPPRTPRTSGLKSQVLKPTFLA